MIVIYHNFIITRFKHMSLIKRLKFGFAENILDKIVNILFRFFEPVLFINFLGVTYYGEWLMIFTIPAYLMMSDIGYVVIGINKINMLVEQKKFDFANEIANKTFTTLLIFNLIFSSIFFIIFFTLNNFGLFNLKLISNYEFLMCLIIFIVFIFVSQLNGFFQRLLACVEFYHLEIRLGYIYRICEISFLSLAMLLGFKAIGLALSLLIINIIFVFINYIYLKSKTDLFNLRFDLDLSYISKNLEKGLFSMAFPIGNAIRNQVTLMVIGSIIGPIAVVITNIYLTISRVPSIYTGISDGVMKIELAKLFISKKMEKLKILFSINLVFTLLFSILSILFLAFAGKFLLYFWVGDNVPFVREVFLLFLIYGLFHCLFISSSNIQFSTNKFLRISKLYISISIIYILILYFITKQVGLIGIPISFLIAEIIIFLFSLVFSMKIIQINFSYILKNMFTLNLIKFIFKKLNF